MKALSHFSMVMSCVFLLGVSLISSTVALADPTPAPQSASGVVADVIQGVDAFVLNSEVASACGWTTKDHARLESARNTMIQNSLRVSVKQGDLSEREFAEAFRTITSTAYVADHAQKALELQKQGVCDNVQVKSAWNLVASSSMQLMLMSEDNHVASSFSPLGRIKSMIQAAREPSSQP